MFGMAFQKWGETLTFNEAAKQHSQIRQMLGRVKKAVPKQQLKACAVAIVDTWNAAAGIQTENCGTWTDAFNASVPLELVPVLRDYQQIPAATFLVIVGDIITRKAALEDIDDLDVAKAILSEAYQEFDAHRNQVQTLADGFGWGMGVCWAMNRKLRDRSGEVAGSMRKIAELAGRLFEAMAAGGIPVRSKQPEEVEGITSGDDVERLMPDEAASIGINPEVLARFADSQATQYQMTGQAVKRRGPMVIVIDESGSMGGDRFVWSKACAVALTRVALEERRAVKIVHFADGCYVQEVRPGEPDDMVKLAETFLNGGTDIEIALENAIVQVGELEKEGHTGADIVFITDGSGNYSEEHFKRMVEMGIALWTVAIEVDIAQIHAQWLKSRGAYGLTGFLFAYARAYMHLNDRAIRSQSGQAIDIALALKQAALDNPEIEEVL